MDTGNDNNNRNRNRRRKRYKRGANKGQNQPKKINVPPPPQTKLVLRNICNAEKYGSVESILSMVKKLVELSNTKNSSSFTIDIDHSAVRYLIQEEELAEKYLQELETARQQKEKDEQEEGEEEEGVEEDDAANKEDEAPENVTTEEEKQPEVATLKPITELKKMDVIVAPKVSSSVPVLMARPLYIIPPKKTRRRGERAGCAYILITAPKIEKIEIPETLQETNQEATTATLISVAPLLEISEETTTAAPPLEVTEETTTTSTTPPFEVTEETPTTSAAPPLEVTEETTLTISVTPPLKVTEGITTTTAAPLEVTVTEAEAAPALIPEGDASGEEETTKEEAMTWDPENVTKPPVPAPPKVDYSNAIAKGRLLLSRSTDFFTSILEEDATGPQEYAGCKIEISMSGKTWRLAYRVDRREGSIESTADFKNWMLSVEKKQEELSARPRPAPGGGTSNLGDSNPNGGEEGPVAALVQHLRSKRQELKRKKAKKKKDKNGMNPVSPKKKKTSAELAAVAAAKKKKKKKKTGRKKVPGGGGLPNKTATVAPVLLKKN
jgi:hypothetical protein